MDVVIVSLPLLIGLDRHCASVRLPQRPARCRKLDSHHRLDPRAQPSVRGALGCVLQLHRIPVLRASRRSDHWQGHRRGERHRSRSLSSARSWARSRGTWSAAWIGGIPSSSSHALVGGLVGAGVTKAGGVRYRLSQDRLRDRTFPRSWVHPRDFAGCDRHLGLRTHFALSGGPLLPPFLVRLGGPLFDGTRRERCSEDNQGIIAVLLFSQGYLGSEFYVPFWVVLSTQCRWALVPCSAAGAL